MTRLVPFKEENWTRLQDLASEIGISGRRVGPAQVAALLIENSLEELEEAQWQEDLAASRSAPLRSQPEAAEAAQVTYNQFDDWAQRGWIVPARRRGHERSYGADEIIRGHWLRSISKTDADIETLASAVRASDLSARYLVVTDGENVSTVPTRSQLYRLLEAPGSHLVIDQLPERRKLLGLPPFPADPNEELSVRRAV